MRRGKKVRRGVYPIPRWPEESFERVHKGQRFVITRHGRPVAEWFRWDSLVVGAAQLQGCTLLLTEDLQDGSVYG
jgi:predicted nucleic acid-binding protein